MAFLLVATMLLLLTGRLVQLQGIDSAGYAKRAALQRTHVFVLPATRGAIVDRNGVPLAVSLATSLVFADPTEVGHVVNATAATLSPMLGVPVPVLIKQLTQRGTRYVVLARAVLPSLARAIIAKSLPGIGVIPGSQRVYPSHDLAANVLGFVPSGPGTGAGLELAYNRLLAGHPGELIAEFGAGGGQIPMATHTDRPAVPGSTLELTLDRNLQWEAQQALSRQVQATGASGGTAIVMDPHTGAVLAMASVPTFDPNNPGASTPQELSNSAITDVYEPGSVNKVITMSAALTEHKITPTTVITVPPSLQLAGQTFHDAEVHGTEHLTVTGILAVSSNLGTIKIEQRIGPQVLSQYLHAYGLGALTGIGLPGESPGLLPPVSQWNPSQQYTMAFGQGIGVTALQMASVYSTLANGGVRLQPRIVRAVIAPDGKATPVPSPPGRRIVSATVAREIVNMLESVTTTQGTAPAAHIAGYTVAGKTGTAQRANPACGCYAGGGFTASFIGMAPAGNPQLVVEVVLRNPKTNIYGGTVAAPVFHQIMSFALKTLQIPPTGKPRAMLPLTGP